jgi:hypothetical protein
MRLVTFMLTNRLNEAGIYQSHLLGKNKRETQFQKPQPVQRPSQCD